MTFEATNVIFAIVFLIVLAFAFALIWIWVYVEECYRIVTRIEKRLTKLEKEVEV